MQGSSFNSPLEIGTRIVLILSALDRKATLNELILLDYALLYSEEFDGPENLHPALPNHIAEIAHRREHIPTALRFFIKRGLIDPVVIDTGHYYESNDHALDFISCLKSRYYKKAWIRLSWMVENTQRILNTTLADLAKSGS